MPEYVSRNSGFGGSAPPDFEDDFEPSPEDINAWNQEASAPDAAKVSEHQDQLEEGTPEPSQESQDDKPVVKKDEPQKTPLQQHREKKQQDVQHQLNELYKQNRLKDKQIRDLQNQLTIRAQGLDKTPEDWLKIAEQFEQYGDFAKAQEARNEAQKLSVALNQYHTEAGKKAAWEANEAEIYEQDPDIFTEGTDTRRRLNELFSDQALAQRYLSHPDGIWAAYHRVRLEQAMELIPKLVHVIEQYRTENERLTKSQSPLTSSPGRGSSVAGKPLSSMSEDEIEKLAMEEMRLIDTGRR